MAVLTKNVEELNLTQLELEIALLAWVCTKNGNPNVSNNKSYFLSTG